MMSLGFGPNDTDEDETGGGGTTKPGGSFSWQDLLDIFKTGSEIYENIDNGGGGNSGGGGAPPPPAPKTGMSTTTKALLIGGGVVVAGAIAYVVWPKGKKK